ncbi:MAG TPA: selenide, water dikinase SelD, partial [Turneriella sp.]|nr:selenide, water dikinase SelD [Turneriella sp.]
MSVRLTQYSHGAGCGCKISPAVLGDILKDNMVFPAANLIVGNSDRDDAAAYLLGEGQVLLSTTDFFMP